MQKNPVIYGQACDAGMVAWCLNWYWHYSVLKWVELTKKTTCQVNFHEVHSLETTEQLLPKMRYSTVCTSHENMPLKSIWYLAGCTLTFGSTQRQCKTRGSRGFVRAGCVCFTYLISLLFTVHILARLKLSHWSIFLLGNEKAAV